MATSQASIAETLESFIRKESQVPPDDLIFNRDVHLYESGYVDSLRVVELITFIESNFKIKLPEEYLFSEEFTTINGISRIIHSSSSNGRSVADPTVSNES